MQLYARLYISLQIEGVQLFVHDLDALHLLASDFQRYIVEAEVLRLVFKSPQHALGGVCGIA